MKFSEILDQIKNIIDETDEDEQIDVIIKSAVNHAYLFDLAPLLPNIETYYIPAVQGIVELPFESVRIIKTVPELKSEDKKVGKNLIVSNDTLYTITCGINYKKLVNDDDEVMIPDQFTYLLVKYACYMYFEHRKKVEVAQSFLQEYKLGLDSTKEQLENELECLNEQVVDKVGFFK